MSLRELFDDSTDDTRTSSGELRTRLHQLFLRLVAPERKLWGLAIAAMVADILLTLYGLEIGLQELNPAARGALESAGVFGLSGLKLWALLVALCCRQILDDRYGGLVPLALAGPSVFAACFNASLIVLVSF